MAASVLDPHEYLWDWSDLTRNDRPQDGLPVPSHLKWAGVCAGDVPATCRLRPRRRLHRLATECGIMGA